MHGKRTEDGVSALINSTFGALHALDFPAYPRLGITPDVENTPTRKIIKTTNAAGSASAVIGWRVTVNPGDDIAAGRRLAEQLEDTFLVVPGVPESRVVDNGDDPFDVYVVCVANVAYNNAAGTILPTNTSEANTRTAMSKMSFPAGTRLIHFTVTESYQLPPSGTPLLQSMLNVEAG